MVEEGGSNVDYLFPPPSSSVQKILAVVVEKKGDETGNSLRQKEIYAFNGYMVMPKIHWNDYEPGDWFYCMRDLSEDHHGNLKERELKDLHKFTNPSVQRAYELPETRFHNGNVQIIRPFVRCPLFIRNRTMRTADSIYIKLYTMYFSQAFVSNHTLTKYNLTIDGNMVYTGIFEFRGKDNGAVNFAPRSRIRDATGHTLERDVMWELVKVTNHKAVPLAHDRKMKEDLADLHKFAKRTHEAMEKKGAFVPWRPPPRTVETPAVYVKPKSAPIIPSRPRAHPDPRINELSKDIHKMAVMRATTQMNDFIEAKSSSDPAVVNNVNTDTESGDALSTTIHFESRKDIEMYRMLVIHLKTIKNTNGVDVEEWVDEESGKTSPSREYLDFAFDIRHKDQLDRFPPSNETPPCSPVLMPSSPGPELDITPELDVMHGSRPSRERIPQCSISELSTFVPDTTSAIPIASSTPRTSPTTVRRRPSTLHEEPDETFHGMNPYNSMHEAFTFTEYENNNANHVVMRH